ncbi:CHASE2 domain-containing protein [Geomonas paludis]|uniref:CHASE2 domain-containing protein n=1 Tax=Geomonas paludis TaxID=2740185 RepID=A0ABY4LK30_9BACT|nr:CHASE2 domain-containing protein [Geomonas paludis]UPU38202.1 CHASE2 domain-containing protein [Geomonas paludis]
MSFVPTFWRDRILRAHFLVNLGIGVLIALVFTVTASTQWGEVLLNAAFDVMVRYEHSSLTADAQGKSPLFFVEITPQEYRQWGEPLITPRDRLASLVETAWQKGAPVVALDVILDKPDLLDPAGDAKLRGLLERMLRENARTQVVLPVRVGSEGDLRPHLFEDLLERRTADGRKILHRAAPIVVASESDLLNRFWGAYEVGRDAHGKPQIIWSLPVVAAALYHDARSGTAAASAELDRAAAALLAAGSREPREAHGSEGEGHHVSIGTSLIHLSALQTGPAPEAATTMYLAGESHSLPYTQRIRFLIPAGVRDRRDAGNFRPGLSPDSLAGRIVLIGNGSPETGDILATPVGRMPGMFLIGNAINTIVSGKMPVHLPAWQHFAIEALIIVFAAWLFLHFHSTLAQILSSLVFIVLLVPFSWAIYQQWGLFFNFLVPVLGMQLHKTADGFEEMIASRGKKHHHHH